VGEVQKLKVGAVDDNKSQANKAKHGIDFVESQALWRDIDRLEIPARR
jgi:hypothetical protein